VAETVGAWIGAQDPQVIAVVLALTFFRQPSHQQELFLAKCRQAASSVIDIPRAVRASSGPSPDWMASHLDVNSSVGRNPDQIGRYPDQNSIG
jgi:hypothetical protein